MTQSEKHQHWTQIVIQQQESGLSIPCFCKEKNISYATFHYWNKKLKHTEDEQIAHLAFFCTNSKLAQGATMIPSGAVYLVSGITDMRKSIDGLSLIVADVLEMDPLSNGKRSMNPTYACFGAFRSPISGLSDRLFRFKPIHITTSHTCSKCCQRDHLKMISPILCHGA